MSVSVVTPTKNVGISLLLTVLLGPIGMFYSTVGGALVMLAVALVFGGLFGLAGAILAWVAAMIWGAMAVSAYNEKLQASVQSSSGGTVAGATGAAQPTFSAEDDFKWDALCRYDNDIRDAVEKLRPHGDELVTRFRQLHMTVNDKSKIPDIIQDLLIRVELDRMVDEAMAAKQNPTAERSS